jgi:3,4-dihydroxy 2-butanone 4-phosphate synthase/GTP cyclohydrolase II
MALVKGEWKPGEPVLVRVHRSCVAGDIFGSSMCNCNEMLHQSMAIIEKEGRGVVVYMNPEMTAGEGTIGVGSISKHLAVAAAEGKPAEVGCSKQQMDQRDYGLGAQILRNLGISQTRLLTDNPKKRVGLSGYGIEVVGVQPITV